MGREEENTSALSLNGPGTIKRLDFEDISITKPGPIMEDLRMESLRILRGLDDLSNSIPEQVKELMEVSMEAAKKFEGSDLPKLEEEYLQLKSELIRFETENRFLNYLAAEGDSPVGDINDEDLEILQKEYHEVQRKLVEETQEIQYFIETFVTDTETLTEGIESTRARLKVCDEKISSWEKAKASENCLQMSNHSTSNVEDSNSGIQELEKELTLLRAEAADLELGHDETDQDAFELKKSTVNMEIEILKLDKIIFSEKKVLEQLQGLANIQTKTELLNTVLSSFSDWNVVGCENGQNRCENGQISFILETPVSHSKQINHVVPSSLQKVAGAKKYKLQIRVNQKTLAVKDVKLDPNDVPIDDIVQAMEMRRTMESSQCSLEPPNDLEFLLRKIKQRISMVQ